MIYHAIIKKSDIENSLRILHITFNLCAILFLAPKCQIRKIEKTQLLLYQDHRIFFDSGYCRAVISTTYDVTEC